MKISLEWLRDFLPGPTDPQQAADALTNGGFPVEGIETHGADAVLDVEVTSNRGDCLSHVGVARELSALMNRELKVVAAQPAGGGTSGQASTSVTIDATDLCPHYVARVIRNVRVGPSPAWLARRLEAIGVRPINNVVDVTNYVLFELGQPLHAFDFDKLEGRRVVVRRARAGEKLVSIDGRERELSADMLVIADAARPVALAGVMGGRDSEVSGATTSVLLESARFDPLTVRKTARALAMKSDSSYRFERGIDPSLPDRAGLRAAQLILETAGGELVGASVAAGAAPAAPKKLSLRLAKLKRVLGIDLPAAEVTEAFRRLQLSPVAQGDRIDVTVPAHRLDLNIEVDLVEEAARVLGYDRVPVRDEIAIRVTPPEPDQTSIRRITSSLVCAGCLEAITVTLAAGPVHPLFIPPEAMRREQVRVNWGTKWGYLRPSLLPTLLVVKSNNESLGSPGVKLFEMGSAFWYGPGDSVVERYRVGIVGNNDLREVRGAIDTLLNQLNANRLVRVVPDNRPGFARGAFGRVEWGGEAIGYLGKIDRGVAQFLGFRDPPAAAELEVPPLLAGAQLVPQLRPLPQFPAAPRDLSLVVPESLPYEAIESLVRGVKPAALEAVQYVTTYRGKPLEKGTKSVTVTLLFRSAERTLTGEEVESEVQKVVEAAKRQGHQLRA